MTASLAAAAPRLEGAYSLRLSEALLQDQELPAPPVGQEPLRQRAADMAAGCPAGQGLEFCRARIVRFCQDLGLDGGRTQSLVEHLSGKAGTASASPAAAQRLVGEKKALAVQANAAAHAAALGVGVYESAPAAQASRQAVFANRATLSRGPAPGRGARVSELDASLPDKAVPWSEIRKVVKFDRGPETDNLLQSWRRRLFDKPSEAELAAERFAVQSMDRMQQTPEGREVLRQLLQEYGRQGKSVLVRAVTFAGSTVDRRESQERIVGYLGMADCHKSSLSFNQLFLQLKDRPMAVDAAASTMAHEFRHLVSSAQVQRGAPENFKIFDSMLALIDEQTARLTGYMVAVRLDPAQKGLYAQEAWDLTQDPEGFWTALKAGGYSKSLDMEEMRDPAAAYQKRIEGLQERINEYLVLMTRRLPKLKMAMDIMTKKEGLGDEARSLRATIKVMEVAPPAELKRTTATLFFLKGLCDDLQKSKNAEYFERMKHAGDSPVFQRMTAQLRRDQEALARLLKDRPVPEVKKDPGQIDWPEFSRRMNASMRAHPEYWREFFKAFPPEKSKKKR